MKVGEGREGDEYIISRFDHVIPAVNIVSIYGQQESRSSKEEIFKSWLRLRDDLLRIENSGEGILIIGDMNRYVGSDELGVSGNHSKVSHGGQLIREMVKENNYVTLNNIAVGGPWTWVQRGKESIKNCLDLAYASKNLMPFIKLVVIDKDRNFTPKRVIWRKKEFTSVYTDHFTMEIVLSGMPRRNQTLEKSSVWNLGKPGGWEEYERLTDMRAGEIDTIANSSDVPIDVKFKKIVNVEMEVKFQAFGKTRGKSNNGKNKLS